MMKRKIKSTRIRVYELGKDGRLRARYEPITAGLIGGKYKYCQEHVFYTRPYGSLLPPSFIVPTVLVRDGVVESYDVWKLTDQVMDAEEFSMVIQNSAFAIYQLLKESEKTFEMVLLCLCGASVALLLYITMLIGGFG